MTVDLRDDHPGQCPFLLLRPSRQEHIVNGGDDDASDANGSATLFHDPPLPISVVAPVYVTR